MWQIIKNEIRDRKYSLLAYCLIGLALIWMYVALFPSIKAASAQLDKIYQSFPKGVFQALGVEELSFNTLEKFLAVELFSFMWPILAIVLALSRAGTTIAGEIEKGTIGLVLSLPISRSKIFLSKYLSGLISIIIFILFTITSILLMAFLYDQTVSSATILKLSFLSLLFIWAVYAAGMFLSTIFSERSKVYMVLGGALFVMYAANVVATLQSGLRWLHRTSIFNYYDAQNVLTKSGLSVSHVVVLLIAVITFTIIGVVMFTKRDIAT